MPKVDLSRLGAGSGINTHEIVDELVNIEKEPKQKAIDNKNTDISNKISALAQLKNFFSNLKYDSDLLKTDYLFGSYTAKSSDPTCVGGYASAQALPGEYWIDVSELAQAHKMALAPIANSGILSNAGSIVVTRGLNTFTTNWNDGESLTSIRNQINKTSKTSFLQASVVNSNSGQHLLLTSTKSGENFRFSVSGDLCNYQLASADEALLADYKGIYQITFVDSGLSVQVNTSALTSLDEVVNAFNQVENLQAVYKNNKLFLESSVPFTLNDQCPSSFSNKMASRSYEALSAFTLGKDAKFRVDGFESSSASNLVEDSIEGVVFILRNRTIDAVRFEVEPDISGLYDKFNNLILSVNQLLNCIIETTTNNDQVQGAFRTDSAIKGLGVDLKLILMANTSFGVYKNLSSIGLTFDKVANLYSWNKNTLLNILATNFEDVKNLMSDPHEGIAKKFYNYASEAIEFGSIFDSNEERYQSVKQQLTQEQSKLDEKIDAYRQRLEKQYAEMDRAVGKNKADLEYITNWIESGKKD